MTSTMPPVFVMGESFFVQDFDEIKPLVPLKKKCVFLLPDVRPEPQEKT